MTRHLCVMALCFSSSLAAVSPISDGHYLSQGCGQAGSTSARDITLDKPLTGKSKLKGQGIGEHQNNSKSRRREQRVQAGCTSGRGRRGQVAAEGGHSGEGGYRYSAGATPAKFIHTCSSAINRIIGFVPPGSSLLPGALR